MIFLPNYFFFLWSNRITKLIFTGSLPHGSVALKSFCLMFYFYHCGICLWGVGVEKRKTGDFETFSMQKLFSFPLVKSYVSVCVDGQRALDNIGKKRRRDGLEAKVLLLYLPLTPVLPRKLQDVLRNPYGFFPT